MKKHFLALSAVLILLTGCASSVTKDIMIDAEADPKANFTGYTSYTWLGSAAIVYDPEGKWEPPQFDADAEIKFLIDRELRKRGMNEDSVNPDLIVAFAAGIDMSSMEFDIDPMRPDGVFLFAGPTGVGKTEVARQLAEQLSIHFERFDMSEYMEKHAVARLIGAPPGYVGFDQGGLLTEAIRKHPYSVLLLDEIEKAHPDIFSILLQVMDHSTLTDNSGRKADFRNVIIIMTTNAGAREMSAAPIGFVAETKGREQKSLKNLFSPEFRNRLDASISFEVLDSKAVEKVVDKLMAELQIQLAERKVVINLTSAARSWLAKTGYEPAYGARPLRRLILKEIGDVLTDEILFGELVSGGSVTVGVRNKKLTFSYKQEK